MSINSTIKEIKKEARRIYEEKLVEVKTAEHNAMNEMLDILRAADGLMTATQIEAACTTGISKYEIAGNLLAMELHRSRYCGVRWYCDKNVPLVNIPHKSSSSKTGERIVTKSGGKRKAVIVEVDEHDNIIPNTKHEVLLYESKRYGVEKIK